ncbi:hypothetical protein WJX82_004852 [Trebouxia sp. C0006]
MHLPTATGEVGPPRSILTFDEEDENKFTNRRDGSIPKGEKFCIAVKYRIAALDIHDEAQDRKLAGDWYNG